MRGPSLYSYCIVTIPVVSTVVVTVLIKSIRIADTIPEITPVITYVIHQASHGVRAWKFVRARDQDILYE